MPDTPDDQPSTFDADEIDDLIDRWHNEAHADVPLHEYLGMTWEEFGIFVTGQPPAASQPPSPAELVALTSPVDRIYAAGFRISERETDDDCHLCGHRWGDHLLVAAFGDPLDGGFCNCPVQDCRCVTTWNARHGFATGAEARAHWAKQREANGGAT